MSEADNYNFILFSQEGNIGKITLNRPDQANTFNREMGMELQDVLKKCKENPDIRVVYLTGSGKNFCIGLDLNMLLVENPPNLSSIINEAYNPIIKRISEIEKPVIAAVNGNAEGMGANIAIACDITVATDSASFSQISSSIGLIPDCGGTYTLPRLIGWQRATALMMLGEKVTAKEAQAMGMIYQAYSSRSFAKSSWALAEKLAQMPGKTLGLIKKAMAFSYSSDLDRQLSIEAELQSTASRTADFKEGIQAFAEKRKPQFNGINTPDSK